MGIENRVDDRPGSLDRVLMGEKRAIARHRVTLGPLVGRWLSGMIVKQIEFPLVAHEILPSTLDASGESDGGTGGELKSKIVGAAVHWR